MKKISLLLSGIVMSVASFAAPASSLSVAAKNESVFNVTYQTSEKGTVKVSIINRKSQIVFEEVLTNIGSFVRPYNFNELSEGEYTVVVEGKNGKQAEKVNYTIAKITSYVKVSEVGNQKNKYVLYVSNNGKQNVTVKILASNGTLLHEQTLEVIGNIGIVYDLNKVKNDSSSITFEISENGNAIQAIQI